MTRSYHVDPELFGEAVLSGDDAAAQFADLHVEELWVEPSA